MRAQPSARLSAVHGGTHMLSKPGAMAADGGGVAAEGGAARAELVEGDPSLDAAKGLTAASVFRV